MNRREFLKTLGTGIAGLSLAGSCASNRRKPNVLLIITDDQGYADLGCLGVASDVQTPNMDQLAAAGTRFTQAYATSPICSPSRMGIMTGTYHERFGTYWYGGDGIHHSHYKTIAELLKAEDYATGYIGKVHYGTQDKDVDNRNFPNNHGFDYFYGFTSPRKHYLNHRAELENDFQKIKSEHKRWGQSLRQEPMWENKVQKDTEGFSTQLFTQKACAFIEKHKDEHFFLQLSYNAVHNFTHQLPPEYLREKKLKGYHDWDPAVEDYYEWYEKGRYPNNPEGREHYLGQLKYMDQGIGKVIDQLKKYKIFKNTLVIMISDNGGSTPIYANNSPLRGSKYTLYEGGIRVPLIISWPRKFLKGVVRDNIVSGLDILPTICGTVNIEKPNNIDGMDLSDLLTGKDLHVQHDVLFWDTLSQTAVRKGKWKFRSAMNKESQDYEMVELELGEFLYDLERDISEEKNLAEKYPAVVDELKKLFKKWKNSINIV
ncbi:MAG: sulfatase-like hydrolase/transferase [Candidatus Marinimicrobia bacterium]|nr:sulfatase-like hydrolase/transferase [Candidatus Neomarinimicrobiota bacterium]